MYARPFIDSLDFARNGRQIDALVPVAGLSRLQDVLDSPEGTMHYIVQGNTDNRERPVLDISIDGLCQLRCQRCLQGMNYPVQHEARLLLCDQAALDALDDDEDEELEGILAEAHLDVLSLLEDEILLSLPIAPRHEPGDCQLAGGVSKQKDESHPFAALEKLKRLSKE